MQSWQYLRDTTTAANATGDAAMLYTQATWACRLLDELLREHVVIAPSITLDDRAPTKSFRERLRALAGGAFGKPREAATPNDE